jgi:hypothetical protein
MKLLALSDVHARFDAFAPDMFPPVDLCLVAGDLTEVGRVRTGEVLNAGRWLAALGERFPVLWIPGNHDLGFHEETFAGLHPRVQNILNRTLHFDGYSVRGVSCSPAYNAPFLVDDWDFMTADEAEEQKAYDFEPVDIVLSHSPPYGCEPRLDYAGYVLGEGPVYIGSRALAAYIDRHKPRLVVCGHVHEATGSARLGSTDVYNVAQTWRVLDL